MTGITFYYDTEAIGLNAADKRELEKYCRVLLRREDLAERLEMLRGAYEREEKERADLSVYASPPVNDVQEVGVFHLLTRSLFSRKVKRNLFRLNVSRYSGAYSNFTSATRRDSKRCARSSSAFSTASPFRRRAGSAPASSNRQKEGRQKDRRQNGEKSDAGTPFPLNFPLFLPKGLTIGIKWLIL